MCKVIGPVIGWLAWQTVGGGLLFIILQVFWVVLAVVTLYLRYIMQHWQMIRYALCPHGSRLLKMDTEADPDKYFWFLLPLRIVWWTVSIAIGYGMSMITVVFVIIAWLLALIRIEQPMQCWNNFRAGGHLNFFYVDVRVVPDLPEKSSSC